MKSLAVYLLLSFFIFSTLQTYPQGKVYLVLGSDTAIWSGMDVDEYHCFYNLSLFTAPATNTATVMSESFRNQIMDSYGNKLKMTWWMIGGNMFRYALNNNVPLGNTMALYLMKKYYGDKINQWGDELSLHYHNFFWSDYDGDGKFWWNQSKTFLETKEDFDLTLAQFLIEEKVFPISFRSGWHFMDNDWQRYLNELLPYSLHNDWPAKRTDIDEPTDNNFDWSLASSEFIPFHPSYDNYQLPGNTKGWNVRSKYMGSVTQNLMNDIFSKADQGKDQLVCLWSHLPDQNFINEITQVNNIAQQAAINYPNVKFQYCSAVEAYQLWLKSVDNVKPEITVSEEVNGPNIYYLIKTNEPIFQKQPFVVVKDKYESYHILQCEKTTTNIWRTSDPFPIQNLAKFGVALSDTIGNLALSFINYLPDDKYIDNLNNGYNEIAGSFTSSSTSAWGIDSRVATLNNGESAKVEWRFTAEHTGNYNLFTQFPAIANQVDSVDIKISFNSSLIEKKIFVDNQKFNQWIFLNTVQLNKGDEVTVEMSTKNNEQNSRSFAADILKVTAFVRDKHLVPEKLLIDIGDLSIDDILKFNLKIQNLGIADLNISDVKSVGGNISSSNSFPLKIDKMGEANMQLIFTPKEIKYVSDTILIKSDDPVNQVQRIAFTVNVTEYFKVSDNELTNEYLENGSWFTSVVQAFGSSSRYAYIQKTPNGPSATFTTQVKYDGTYELFEILPTTVNSADNALYVISNGSNVLDSVYLNQNEGSGKWKKIGTYQISASQPVKIKVKDSGESVSGPVIRVDAFKLALIEKLTDVDDQPDNLLPNEFKLEQNYPNPFNPSTKISWQSPISSNQTIKIYDLLGNEIATLVDEYRKAGRYEVEFDSSKLSSGTYFYRLQVGEYSEVKKMIMVK